MARNRDLRVLEIIEHQAGIEAAAEALHHETIFKPYDIHNRLQVKHFFINKDQKFNK